MAVDKYSAQELWDAVETLENAARYILALELSDDDVSYTDSSNDAYHLLARYARKAQIAAEQLHQRENRLQALIGVRASVATSDFGKPSDVGFGGAQ